MKIEIASHFRLLLNKYSIGCGKPEAIADEIEGYINIIDSEGILGAALSAKNNVKLLYPSPCIE